MPDTTSDDASVNWRSRTKAVHGGSQRSQFGETSEALFLTSGYVYANAEEAAARFRGEDDGFIYSRFSNPTVGMFESRMAAMEGAEAAWATATGMAAVSSSLLAMLRAGDHVVGARALFGSCRYIVEEMLPRFGIQSTLVDGRDLAQWQAAIRPNTKALFLESPTNPNLQVSDLRGVADIAHAAGARLIVDNVFATPILQRPLEFGADVVVYSATKHIDGQGRCLGGVILGSKSYINDEVKPLLRHMGPALSPFNAWVLLKSLETLDLRVRVHSCNGARIADFLSRLPGIANVLYPERKDHPQHDLAMKQMQMGGNIVAFDVGRGDRAKAAAFHFLNALKLIKISNNLGDAKSLITHPATTTHFRLTPQARAELDIGEGCVRLSVGLEDMADIEADLDQAAKAAQN
ncbi:MAG: O-succinylhomoserine sulfhydrylase [Alphaproteobacteria bacterium]|nr:O-succinylhomoserine sulfhydrylase [Alphaproteobacteria bacterium]